MLNGIAFLVIIFLIIVLAAVIVFLGSLPGKIARRRGHPWPDAVNAASWIGLATGVFWPVAFIWAFLPYPKSAGGASADATDVARLQARIAELESALHESKSQSVEGM